MSIPAAWPHVLDFFGTPLVIEPLPGQLTSHAGLPPVRPFDERLGLTRAFTDPLDDPRDPASLRTPSGRWFAPGSTVSWPATRTRTTDDRKLTAPGFLRPSFLGFMALGHDTLPHRLEIVFAGVQVAGVFIFPALEGQGVPGASQEVEAAVRVVGLWGACGACRRPGLPAWGRLCA
jgi:hypothetical protein